MNQHEKLNYVEFSSKDLEATKAFFSAVFEWDFVDYGPEYTAFSNQGLDGGFFKADVSSQTQTGGAYWCSIAQTCNPLTIKLSPKVVRFSVRSSIFRADVVFTFLSRAAMSLQCGLNQYQMSKLFDTD